MRDPRVHRLRLEAEVQLFGQVVGKIGDHVLCREPPAQLGQFDGLGEALQDLQVGGDPAADARPLDFDDDLLAAVQGRVVHLRDGRRGERLFIEGGEQLRRVAAELLGEELVHLARVGGWHPVEQAAEFARQRFAERAGAGGNDLSELHIRRPQVGERLRDLLDDLLLPRALARQIGDDASGGAGELPAGDGYPGRFDRQRHPVKLGHLAVFGRTHLCSLPNRQNQVPIAVSSLTLACLCSPLLTSSKAEPTPGPPSSPARRSVRTWWRRRWFRE